MRYLIQHLARASLAAGLLAACTAGLAQEVTPNYALTRPAWPAASDPDLLPRSPLLTLGRLELSTATSGTGAGLSLQAGQQWFARVGVGRSLDSDVVSLGGGYRFSDGQALSMHVTRQLGQERLGLAVRYDWSRSYLRLSYEAPTRPMGGADMLRFSAGMRF